MVMTMMGARSLLRVRVPFMVVISLCRVRMTKVELGARAWITFLGEVGERGRRRVATDETWRRVTAGERSSGRGGRKRGMARLGVTVSVDGSTKKGVGEGVWVGGSRVVRVVLILARRVVVPRRVPMFSSGRGRAS